MATTRDEDFNLVEMWLRKDPTRWVAGAMAGVFAGLVMLAFAMVLSKILGAEAWLPVKILALPVLGNSATEFGLGAGAIVGLIVTLALTAFLGAVFAHFTFTNSLTPLLGMGVTWGAFTWIFIFNLFIQSFPTVSALRLPPGAALPVLMVFGVALTSVAFFDRMIRRR